MGEELVPEQAADGSGRSGFTGRGCGLSQGRAAFGTELGQVVPARDGRHDLPCAKSTGHGGGPLGQDHGSIGPTEEFRADVRYVSGLLQRAGLGLRDARGNSARVFSPKARKRMRRSAEWYEKKEGQRNILGGLAVAGTVAGTAGGLLVGRRIWKPKAKVKIAENVLKGPWKKRA